VLFSDDDSRLYTVLVNDRGQYSLWPASRRVPSGWASLGVVGIESECKRHVDAIGHLRDVPGFDPVGSEYAPSMTVHSVVAQRARDTPSAIAASGVDFELTYDELNGRANQLANALLRRGIDRGSVVGVCLERSAELIVAFLGVLKAGAAFLPIDADHPPNRLTHMLADASPKAIVTTGELLSALPVFCDSIAIDDPGSLELESRFDPGVRGSGQDLAYIMYTSGSTGRPKGVAIEHAGILRLVLGQKYARFGPNEVTLLMSPVTFDASTFEIWGALLHGGRCAVFPPGEISLARLREVLAREKVTLLWFVASLFNVVIDHSPELIENVGQVLVGGEKLSVPHVQRALQALPNTQFIQGYGPTEATTFACCHRISPVDLNADSIPIGSPLANTDVLILDENLSEVAQGVRGEICIGGVGLARGYLNQAGLTAERFIAWPDGRRPGERVYRTGDFGRKRADGKIEFLGRVDHQIKVRGFRIELGEIEHAIMDQGLVRSAVVLARGKEGRKKLVAFVVPTNENLTASLRKPGDRGTGDESIDFGSVVMSGLAEKLPKYMIPSRVVVLDEFPLTTSGKVDRQALADLGEPPKSKKSPLEEVVRHRAFQFGE
jgi:amino acid adenylation domain-containing protein